MQGRWFHRVVSRHVVCLASHPGWKRGIGPRLVGRKVEIPEEDRPRHDASRGRREGGPYRLPRPREAPYGQLHLRQRESRRLGHPARSVRTTRPLSSTTSSDTTRRRRWSLSGSRCPRSRPPRPGVRLGLLRQQRGRRRPGRRGHLRYAPTGRLSPRGKGGPSPGCHCLQEPREGVYRQARHPVRHRPRHHPERRGRPPRDRKIPLPELCEGVHLLRLGPLMRRAQTGRPPLLLGRREAVPRDRRRGDEALLRRLGPERRRAPPARSDLPLAQVGPRGGDRGARKRTSSSTRTDGERSRQKLPAPCPSLPPTSPSAPPYREKRLRGRPRRGGDRRRCPLSRMGPCRRRGRGSRHAPPLVPG